jgi:hypothetical protein
LNYPVGLDDMTLNDSPGASRLYEGSVDNSKYTKGTNKTNTTMNPYNTIDVTLKIAKEKLASIKAKSAQIDEIEEPDKKKKFLKNENK